MAADQELSQWTAENLQVPRNATNEITPPATSSSSISSVIPPDEVGSERSRESIEHAEPGQASWTERRIHRWKSPLLMAMFFAIGFAMSLAHCIFYARLAGKIVGNPDAQEQKLRFGTAFAFLAQIFLGGSCWIAYTQWLWRTLKKDEVGLTPSALDAAFGVDLRIWSLLNLEMLQKLRIGSIMAAFAWSLLLPPFFTPATLFVYQSSNMETLTLPVPYPNIANSSVGHKYAYSPPSQINRTQYLDDANRIFTGPRTILSTIAAATASLGEILPLKPLHNTSAYSFDFFAPVVQCLEANATAIELITNLREEEMRHSDKIVVATENVYYSFVPTYNSSGGLVPGTMPRQQYPSNGSNELWMTFLRPSIDASGSRIKQRHFMVCSLYNTTYHMHVEHSHGIQNITGSYTTIGLVPYPNDNPSSISNMAQHAYSAFMTALCDQLVGKFSWYVNTAFNRSSPLSIPSGAPQFGALESQIQRTSLLGSLDLDAFFELNEEKKLYKNPEGNGTLSDQRLMDKSIARNRTLDVLIEELSFNMSVSLMWNDLLTDTKPISVQVTHPVNRYAYQSQALFIPYALANVFALTIVVFGFYSYMVDGVLADKTFRDIVRASGDPEVLHIMTSRRRSLTASLVNGRMALRAGTAPDEVQKEALRKVKMFLRRILRRQKGQASYIAQDPESKGSEQ
ncbi:hypothetical protein CC80DRAFT_466327 [Byssothecium circinans]|uniref:Uncharacterized protein n=1 Tax=Byssothecium circinans TaxID=147558 RepID=A0A6A5U817_9PLEO|nr:hypothetical protein CC80DRAFT_466327 [Byssothecium circinans]